MYHDARSAECQTHIHLAKFTLNYINETMLSQWH